MDLSSSVIALAALAQESRLQVFRLLVQAGPDGLPAGKIATALGVPATTLSFHLNALTQAGLIARRRQGRSLIYAAVFATMNDLLGFLTEDCCQGQSISCSVPTCQIDPKSPQP